MLTFLHLFFETIECIGFTGNHFRNFRISTRNICQANYRLSVLTQQFPMWNRRIAIIVKRGVNSAVRWSCEFVFCKWITSLFLRWVSWIIRHPPYSIHVGVRGSVNSLVKRGTWSIGCLVWSNTNQGPESELQHGRSFILQNIVLNFLYIRAVVRWCVFLLSLKVFRWS